MSANYPFVTVELSDPRFPLRVELEAFTPFIPLNADDLEIPTALFRCSAFNTPDTELVVSIAGSMPNPAGYDGEAEFFQLRFADTPVNEERHIESTDGGVAARGVFLATQVRKRPTSAMGA